MRSQHEIHIFSAVIKYCQMEGEYLIETSSSIFSPTSTGEVIPWDNISFAKLSSCGSFFDGAYNVQKATYDDWLLVNNQRYLLKSAIANPQVKLISEAEFDQLCDRHDYRWSVFHYLTRPGFSGDFSQALIQITAHCPAGPPQYGSILYLERTDETWQVKSSHGLYNQ